MKKHYDILIVGAGHAGAQAAIALRQQKFDGSIGLMGNEKYPPYERPPLSKEYLAGDKEFERIMLRPQSFWGERDIELLTGCRVANVDPAGRFVVLTSDEEVSFGKLIWATGGSPRMLDCPGSQARNIHGVRSRADVDKIMAALPTVEKVVVIGGGYIGLEAAAVLRKLGKTVTVVESLNRVLSRVAGEPLSRFYEQEHRNQGVTIELNAKVESFETGDDGMATAVQLADGRSLAGDMFIVGIGIIPETGPLVAAGAAAGNGVDVDQHCRTSLENIYAIGDCAAHSNPFAGGALIRLESVQNANDQAKVAALDIVGEECEYNAVPWFWSNQYDLKLQTVGISTGHDEHVLRGNPDDRSFSIVYFKDDKVIALDCVNRTKDYVQGRKAVVEGLNLDRDEAANPEIPLKEVGLV
ncbi:3-phenylpropionate/trans-cinnamate dioxygenase ferredoxin reductase subunit [Parasphingorhabdus marina DSM 22363]|uniref:3-phenylpropionate/trans-cinnamate dioxygenase ferredoxin reductase subunit n=1 Tax=Parasphingorhabdus marina DSM 22363 TaxID=1123272 RepID=A0A1N6F711_9SPHN|nr:FAD-dependent oxidoreductase [Parasphingorhabdus marina]SIN90996.1 3-phenylpropionate/trans-cinnamate dioxygenase ferredoxin reductase subunit [Parasphingorhabdus marina DSM 22363]